jgi:hypothetical protein
LEVLLSLFVWFVEALGPSYKLNDHLVVEEVELPSISAWVLGVVVVGEDLLLDVVDVELAGDPLV